MSIRYDFGSDIQEVVESGRKCNDGLYHHLSFQRIGTKFKLQIDDLAVGLYSLQGKMAGVLQTQKTMTVTCWMGNTVQTKWGMIGWLAVRLIGCFTASFQVVAMTFWFGMVNS